jgi:hypothetical protein
MIGESVIRIGTEEHGVVIDVKPPRRGRQLYVVKFPNHTSDEFEVNLMPDCDISDPFERCMSGIFGSYTEFTKKNTSFKIGTSNNSTISSLKSSKTVFQPYQYKPLLKFLNSANHRLLIADEVGLGKTIEAGHIMLELKARKELNNVLIVCPKSLQYKWKKELETKFGLIFTIYEHQRDLIRDMKEQRVSVHAIVNYEKIREDNKKNQDSGNTTNLIDYLKENDFNFSLVLCDEAHRMRNSNTHTYHGANILMTKADAAVFLTATPVMISSENLYNLLHLLDNTKFYQYQIFENRIQENRPFIEALSGINHKVPFNIISQELEDAEIKTSFVINDFEFLKEDTVGNAFADNVMYQEIQRILHGEDSPKVRARLQYLLSSMSVMNNIFSRTRKREVIRDMSQAERKPHMRKVVLTPEERLEFDAIIEQYYDDNSYTDIWGEEKLTKGGALGLVQKKRQIASSVYAYLNSETNLNAGIDEYEEKTDAKFEELIRIIEEVFKHGTQKIVIFALFRKTLKYLQIRLQKRGYGALMIHGMIQNRSELLYEFQNNPNAHILLSSEVGSEGLDMQFCNSMVNYDLPWNPMVVEQRIGRIDRFGQKSPVVNIYNFIVADSIQEDIYIRLLDRIGIFKGTVGDMEAILDAPIKAGSKYTIQEVYNQLEKELYTSQLTEEERQRKIEEVELAIANESETIKHLQEDLDNTLTNDAYFKDEIRRIQNNNAYVTEIELKNFLGMVIRQELTSCSLNDAGDNVYELKLPLSNPKVLKNFLIQNRPQDEESISALNRFIHEIENQTSIRITFNQEKAYSDGRIYFLNMYHPVIQACQIFFSKNDDNSSTSFSYALSHDNLLEKDKLYYLIVYKVKVERKVQGVPKYSESLLPLLYDVKERHVVDDEDTVNRIFSRSQTDGKEANAVNEGIDSEMIQDMRYDFAEIVTQKIDQRRAELLLQVQGDNQQTVRQTEQYYDRRIQNLKNNISKWETEYEWFVENDEKKAKERLAMINLFKTNIGKLEADKEQRLVQINESSHIEMTQSVVSLNLVNII